MILSTFAILINFWSTLWRTEALAGTRISVETQKETFWKLVSQ